MRTQTESFVSQIILSQHINPYHSDGDVDSPTGFFGYMTFSANDFVIDGMDTPTEFLGRTVSASENEFGTIYYDVISKEYLETIGEDMTLGEPAKLAESLAETWFNEKESLYADWIGTD